MNDIPTITELTNVLKKFRSRWFAYGTIRDLRPIRQFFREPPSIGQLLKEDPTDPHVHPTITLTPRLMHNGRYECVVWEYNGPVTSELPE